MENVLSFKTKTMYVFIDKYEKYSFNYQGWTVSDNYVFNENSPLNSLYSICITSPSISTEDELNSYSLQGQKIAEMITELIPISGLPSLNPPKYKSFCNNWEFIAYKSAPSGWSTNYTSIQSMLNREKDNKISLDVTFEGFVHPVVLDHYPLHDVQHMLEHYDGVDEQIKFLLFLNNSILSATDINVFMLIGKALEMINDIYPYKNHQGSKDRRIEQYFQELLDVFKDTTIKRLLDWSNNRKETRHYNNKKEKNPHDSLSSNERRTLCRCSTSLIVLFSAQFCLKKVILL